MSGSDEPLVIGWEEWAALPTLGLPAIKVKIDTGARTSALHAFMIEPFGPASAPMVRFGIHPVPGRHDIEVVCAAPVVDRREVRSSNGETERRYVVASDVEIGGRVWPIEITLTNRETMAYRMLLGRQAIRSGVLVDPSASFRQTRRSYRLYRALTPGPIERRRQLDIALLTANPTAPASFRLAQAAARRGHRLHVIDVRSLGLGEALDVRLGGQGLPSVDAVVPRLSTTSSVIALAAIRSFESAGAFSLNPAAAMEQLLLPLTVLQRLAEAGMPVLATPSATERLGTAASRRWGGRSDNSQIHRFLIIGGRAVGSRPDGRHAAIDALMLAHAERSACLLNLGLCGVEIAVEDGVARIRRVTAAPGLRATTDADARTIAERVIASVEHRSRPKPMADDQDA